MNRIVKPGLELQATARARVWIQVMSLVGISAFTLILHDTSRAASTLDPQQSHAWGANVGWLNWRPDSISGVEVTEYICAGFIYSANLGWINMGDGQPANRIRYQNGTASDFGVNIDAAGNLRGWAYSANAGWIAFENVGRPHLDLHTGIFSGLAYGANIGWISLTGAGFSLAVSSISSGLDSDADGLTDAWEQSFAGNLSQLSGTGDFDQDGQSDLQEYLADTDPADPEDRLRVLAFFLSGDRSTATISWSSKPTRQYTIETRADFDPGHDWTKKMAGLQLADGLTTTRTLPAVSGHEVLRIRAVRPLSP